MNNLEKFGVVELQSKEMEAIDGGGLFTFFVLVTLFVITINTLINIR